MTRLSMIPKSGCRFSEKIMLQQKIRAPFRFRRNGSGSNQSLQDMVNESLPKPVKLGLASINLQF
jgi:hypothetical protein